MQILIARDSSPKETQVLFEPLKTKYMFAEEQKLIEEKKKEAEDQ